MRTSKLFALALAISFVGSAFSQSKPVDTQPSPSLQRALQATQLLTAQKCEQKANLDPASIQENSTAYAFIAALFENSTPERLHEVVQPLSEKLTHLHCDSTGILQLI